MFDGKQVLTITNKIKSSDLVVLAKNLLKERVQEIMIIIELNII